ncbi:ADP-ribosylglycohydrolase-domain-containing protein [Crepidotus variabilis]|uniref:ADP-ribosylhydrolase ARH3 n=1 Tax=Crepidotus variabilis TaxID=179855 RepID=A0A9P6E6R4_9AGAR|nr:ADP-ribosylglycohydrolase-domain-containing protein [Crepidotus variabilis]
MPSFSGFLNRHKKEDSQSQGQPSAGSSSSQLPGVPPHLDLHIQHPTPSSTSTKIKMAVLTSALIDALGFGNEFTKRFSVPFLDTMKAKTMFQGIPAGSWTDDTSMMLCLATSIIESYPKMKHEGKDEVWGMNQADQLTKYWKWKEQGYMGSVPGKGCFDIGNQVRRAVSIWDEEQRTPDSPSPDASTKALLRIKYELKEDRNSGNGSLMRILPVGLVYWRDVNQAKVAAKLSSETTHPNRMCVEVCQVWTCLIARVMQEMDDIAKEKLQTESLGKRREALSKLELLEVISEFPFTNEKLREVLTVPPSAQEARTKATSPADLEKWYLVHHPLLKLISSTQSQTLPSHYPSTWTPPSQAQFPYIIPPTDQLSSSGYVLNTLLSALYCFFATTTFEGGALMAINLCDDADTVGAIYAGLAAVWYGCEENDSNAGSFWTPKMKEWKKGAKSLNTVQYAADGLVKLDEEIGKAAAYWDRVNG